MNPTPPNPQPATPSAEALKLARENAALRHESEHHRIVKEAALKENAALREENRSESALIDRLSKLLEGVANGLRGPAADMTSHDYSRLPVEAAALKARIASLEAERDRLNSELQQARMARHASQELNYQTIADQAARLATLEAERDHWRVSSVCRELQKALSGLLKASIEYDYAAHEEARREAGVQLIAARTAASKILGRCPQGLDMENPAAPLHSDKP